MPGPNLHPMSLQKFGEILTPKVKVMPPAIGWNTYPPENWHKPWNRPMGFLVKCHHKNDITELGRAPRTFWKQHYLNQLFCLTLRIHPSRFTFLFGYCILLKKDTSGIPILSSSHPSIPPLTETAKNIQLCFPILRIYLGNVQPKPPRWSGEAVKLWRILWSSELTIVSASKIYNGIH